MFTCDHCCQLRDGSSKRYTMSDGTRGIACSDCWPLLAP
jgi:hypothetical protein